jgi:hypothetical protein
MLNFKIYLGLHTSRTILNTQTCTHTSIHESNLTRVAAIVDKYDITLVGFLINLIFIMKATSPSKKEAKRKENFG